MAEHAYTSEDFERARRTAVVTGTGRPIYDAIALAALRIAAAVMRPGVIEGCLQFKPMKFEGPGPHTIAVGSGTTDFAEAIRLALLQDTRNG